MTDAATAAGREHAFHEFFETQYAELTRLAYLVTGEAETVADDLVADALLEVWRYWDRVVAADSPVAYARGVLVNLARNRIRQLQRERRGMLGLVPLWVERTYARDVDVPTVIDVRGALRRLPYRRRACVVLRYAFDLSEQDTARTLGISVGTVKSQTSRGVTQLAALLGRTRRGQHPGVLSSATDRTDSSAPGAWVATPPRRSGREA
jgi:RNA polymerase sigma-70 factor (sigma-E family)